MRTLAVGDVIRNKHASWYGSKRRVTQVHKDYYEFIVTSDDDYGCSSTASYSVVRQLFHHGDWMFEYPSHIQLPEGI